MLWAKTNNFRRIENCPFVFYPQDVNVIDQRRNTPLFYACYNGNVRMCQFLCEKGANLNEICSKNDTPLHMAFKSGSPGVSYNQPSFEHNLTYLDCHVYLQQRRKS